MTKHGEVRAIAEHAMGISPWYRLPATKRRLRQLDVIQRGNDLLDLRECCTRRQRELLDSVRHLVMYGDRAQEDTLQCE